MSLDLTLKQNVVQFMRWRYEEDPEEWLTVQDLETKAFFARWPNVKRLKIVLQGLESSGTLLKSQDLYRYKM